MKTLPLRVNHTAAADTAVAYNGIDLVKFICCILVCMIHIRVFPNDLHPILPYLNFGLRQFLCRLAVPFFFICSGFFLFRRQDLYQIDWDRIRQYCFKLLRLYGIWVVLLVRGGTYHLWYLGATVFAILLLSLLLSRGIPFHRITALACILYAIGLMGDAYSAVFAPLKQNVILKYVTLGYGYFFDSTRNGLFMGFLYVLMGAAFARYEIKMKLSSAFIGFIISLALMLAEILLLKHFFALESYNICLLLPAASFFLFRIASSIQLKARPLYPRLRIVGVLVYFMHLLVRSAVKLVISLADKHLQLDIAAYEFAVCILLTLLAALVIEKLSHKAHFKWLRYLYS